MLRHRSITIVVAFAAIAAFSITSVRAQDRLKSESFDRDPHWEGYRNRLNSDAPVTRQSFGWRDSRHAGGMDAGEIGGWVGRSLTRASYARQLDKPLSLDDRLEASGRLAVTDDGGSSGALVGWFNESSEGWRTPNSLAFRVDGNSAKYWVFAEYGTRNGYTGCVGAFEGERYQTTPTAPFKSDGTRHRWTLRYDPDANDGNGEITFQIDERTYQVPVTAQHRADGAVFNRFGIWNQQSTGSGVELWLDDLVVNGKSFSFDDDPKWIGENNDVEFAESYVRPFHQFGYSETNFTGGSDGELGGIIWRDERPSYYADRVGPLSLDDELQASGKLVFRRAGPDSAVYIGWFNEKSKTDYTSVGPNEQRQYLGILLEGPSRVGHYLRPGYSTSKGTGRDRDTGPVVRPGADVHEWTLHYRPEAADGRGKISMTLDGKETTLELDAKGREIGARFDRFGLFNVQSGGWHVEVYVDDLSYTSRRMTPNQ